MESEDSPVWICMIVNMSLLKKSDGIAHIRNKLNSIFGDDLCSLFFLGGNDRFVPLGGENDSFVEDYVFVNCHNYFDHADQIVKTEEIIRVLDSFKNPVFIPEDQVEEFRRKSVVVSPRRYNFLPGDIVVVKSGHLRNLIGIVISSKNGLYEVLFKFFTSSFTRLLLASELEFVKSVFDSIKCPIVKSTKGNGSNGLPEPNVVASIARVAFVEEFCSEGQLHRTRNRRCKLQSRQTVKV